MFPISSVVEFVMKIMEIFYKYKSVQDLKRFLELVYSQKLYAPRLEELNDAKEGAYHYPKGSSVDERKEFRRLLDNTYTCSLSKLKNNGHMFAIYGDSHKGCCIELTVTANSWENVDVTYQSKMPTISTVSKKSISEVIKIKSPQWGDEEEVRYYKTLPDNKQKQYLAVRILRIMFGVKVSKKDFSLYKSAIYGINPNIEVIHLTEKDIDFGFDK
jgi:hypothetical protein